MASFEESICPTVKEMTFEKYPLRLLEPSINNFSKVLKIDLERLQEHQFNIIQFKVGNNKEALNKEHINASRTIKQLKSNLKELQKTRLKVLDNEIEMFDARMEPVQQETSTAVCEFLEICNKTKEDLVDILEKNDSQETLSLPIFPLQQTQVDKDLSPGTEADDKLEHSLQNLLTSLDDLNEIMSTFADIVHSQQEKVDTIEDNITQASENVQEGTSHLAKASKLKAALYPMAGAVIGGAVGGPVGLLAGLKIGGLAAVGGGIVGYTSGQFMKRKQQEAVDYEMQDLKENISSSKPNLDEAEDDENNKEM